MGIILAGRVAMEVVAAAVEVNLPIVKPAMAIRLMFSFFIKVRLVPNAKIAHRAQAI